jgi:hypothetical protein
MVAGGWMEEWMRINTEVQYIKHKLGVQVRIGMLFFWQSTYSLGKYRHGISDIRPVFIK